MHKATLLLIDDDQDFLDTMRFELEGQGFDVYTSTNLQEVTKLTEDLSQLDYSIIDLRIGNDSGLEIIPLIRKRYPSSHITMLTAYGSIATTVEAMKRGSNNYVMKPCSTQEILVALGKTEAPLQKDDQKEPDVPDLYRKEREYIDYILQMKKGNISQAAQALGIKRQSLQRKLRKFIPKN